MCGHLHSQRDDAGEAMQAWVTAYQMAVEIEHFNILDALEKLAVYLEMPGGLEAWQEIADKIER